MIEDPKRLLIGILIFGSVVLINRLLYKWRAKQDRQEEAEENSPDTKSDVDKDDW